MPTHLLQLAQLAVPAVHLGQQGGHRLDQSTCAAPCHHTELCLSQRYSALQEARAAMRHAEEEMRRCFSESGRAHVEGNWKQRDKLAAEGHSWRAREMQERQHAGKRIFAKK